MLRAALVGTGLIATQKHLPAWKRVRELANLVALCDTDLQRAQEVAQRFGVPKIYTDLQILLNEERPDILDICTPPQTHALLAQQGLRAGAHVLVEKPMATSTEECDAMIALAEEMDRSICVAHSDLFYPAFTTMRQLVDRGAIGELRGMHIYLSTPVDYITSKPHHWANHLPGGVIGETGPHVVYMTLAFINPIADVQVRATKLLPEYPWSPFEDYRLTLRGERAVSGVTLTYATNQWAAQVHVWGSRGAVQADLQSQGVAHVGRTELTARAVGLSTMLGAAQMTSGMLRAGMRRTVGRLPSTHEVLTRAFCRSVQEGTAPPVTAQEGRESIRVMDAIVSCLEENTPSAPTVWETDARSAAP